MAVKFLLQTIISSIDVTKFSRCPTIPFPHQRILWIPQYSLIQKQRPGLYGIRRPHEFWVPLFTSSAPPLPLFRLNQNNSLAVQTAENSKNSQTSLIWYHWTVADVVLTVTWPLLVCNIFFADIADAEAVLLSSHSRGKQKRRNASVVPALNPPNNNRAQEKFHLAGTSLLWC